MDMTSPELTEILDAIAVLKEDKALGRARLLRLWDEHSRAGDALQLCALSHVLADTETDVARELDWDLSALEAATGAADADQDRDARPPVPESYLPSLHLSVADGYRRLGDLDRARRHLGFAENHMAALPDDAYGALIRAALRRLRSALATAFPSP